MNLFQEIAKAILTGIGMAIGALIILGIFVRIEDWQIKREGK